MDELEKLRVELISYVKRKFYTRYNIIDMADEIVNQAFLDVLKSPNFDEAHYNFGYLSVACIRIAYKLFHRNDYDSSILISFDITTPLIDENTFIEDIEKPMILLSSYSPCKH